MASHRGTGAQAVYESAQRREIDVLPQVLICNNGEAQALMWARSVGLECRHLSSRTQPDPASLDAAIAETLERAGVELVVLSGYMKRLGPRTLMSFAGRILNIHPALLPDYGGQGMYGIHVHEAVLSAGASTTGISVHVVEADYDTGPVLYQARIPVLNGETAPQLQERVARHEPRVYLRTLALILNGTIPLGPFGHAVPEPVVEDILD